MTSAEPRTCGTCGNGASVLVIDDRHGLICAKCYGPLTRLMDTYADD